MTSKDQLLEFSIKNFCSLQLHSLLVGGISICMGMWEVERGGRCARRRGFARRRRLENDQNDHDG